MNLIRWSLSVGLLVGAGAGLAADPDLGRDLAAGCAACHGTNGHPVAGSEAKALAGVPRQDLLRMLVDFRDGTRPGTVMPQIARGYSEAQIEAIAAHFAAQP